VNNVTINKDVFIFLLKSTDSLLGRKAWHLCLHFARVVLCSEPFFPAATLESRRAELVTLHEKGLKLPLWLEHPSCIYNDEASPGARVIMCWEPHCSPQMMTVIPTSPEP
jgi:hypothetical protein